MGREAKIRKIRKLTKHYKKTGDAGGIVAARIYLRNTGKFRERNLRRVGL